MQYTSLGNTGLQVSVAGLGCGGNSRLGQSAGKNPSESLALVRAAMDLGVNFLDTAAAYGTEEIVGKAIKAGPREQVIVSSKAQIRRDRTLFSAADVIASLEQSLQHLDTDYIDVFHVHAVPPWAYDHVIREIVPALQRERDKGKFRFLGLTETPPNDAEQSMLQRAIKEDAYWQVIMLGYHMLNQKARQRIFPQTLRKGIGTLLMFVVRNIFSVPGRLQSTLKTLAAERKVSQELARSADPLSFLVHENGADSLIDAAYRFARHEPGADVVLFGTGDVGHVQSNIESILKPPLPRQDIEKLYQLFGNLEGVGLDLPNRP